MSLYRKVLEKMKKINCIQKERGAIFVLTAVLLPIMFGCLGIAYDVGNLYMHKARLQNVTDAAALAGGRAFLESQKKITGTKDDIDENTDGKAEKEYVIGGSQTLSGKHQDADKAADDYIYKNIINLGEKVYSDKYSHYALKGIKKNAAVEGQEATYTAANEIFYRVGLSETVRLYFLPIFTKKNIETVRAGSVVVLQPGTTTVIPGSGGGSSTITHPSMFDNLYTYSEYFDAGLANANHIHNATYEGNMVFTYGNGNSTKEHFYDIEKITGGQTQSVDHLFNDASASLAGIRNPGNYTGDLNDEWAKVNDPIINTYFNTEAYVDAFKSKLNLSHYDVHDQNLTITGDITSNSTCRLKYVVSSGEGQGNYDKVDDEYYLLNSNGEHITFKNNGKTYTVCYHKIPDSNFVIRCGKTEGDNTYYVLTADNRITNCYIKMVQPDPNNAYWITEALCLGNDTTILHYNGTYVDSNWQPTISDDQFSPGKPATPIDLNNFQQQAASGGSVSTNVYHVSSKFYGNVPNLVLNANGQMSGNSNEPIYVIVEADITHMQINIKNNSRPIIFVYFGTSNVLINNNGITPDDVAKLTIYAPYGTAGIDPDTEQLNYSGTFRGNVIARRIAIQASGGASSKWIQENHLENANYTDADVATVTSVIEDNIKNSTQLPDDIKEKVMQRYANALNMNPEDMSDPLFYSKLGYNAKQTLYTTWKSLLQDDDFSAYANQLWPWNEHFDIKTGEDQTVTTDEKLRLINYRTDFQVNEDGSIPENKVLDPFIFETLAKPDSY
ncbi:MAG: Tad domain-containing protein [Succiniclasticum sp.]|uniref:Tad domain-containing protein n=1 Tax=Succiniclasticum sp. TaxID=2775030 RepID=UPI002A9117CA|nr:Tad domain-containing protein [Succiniclasticum sp.]MDY6290808.1 Tad domain-containing protein [Succiniclasticum sp.]